MASILGGKSPVTKDICRLYFGLAPNIEATNTWKCTCGTERKCNVKKFGYGNLMSHIQKSHPNYLEIYEAHRDEHSYASGSVMTAHSISGKIQTNLDHMIDSKSSNVYKWLDWIIMDELELNFCEKTRTRQNSSLSNIGTKTLKKYLFKLVAAVEKKITTIATASQCYALLFDGWSEDSCHFIGKDLKKTFIFMLIY